VCGNGSEAVLCRGQRLCRLFLGALQLVQQSSMGIVYNDKFKFYEIFK
jgi:hypothetical protein